MKILKYFYNIFKNIMDTIIAFFCALFQKHNVNLLLLVSYDEIFITHTFGGGTKTFENNYLNKKTNYLIIRNVRGFKTKYFTVETSNKRFFVSEKRIYDFLSRLNCKEISVSSIVPYTNWKKFLEELVRIKKEKQIYIRYMIHDFHCVCPNYTLVDDGKYCSIHCVINENKCLCKEEINEWRIKWGFFLTNIDEIRIFNESSREVLIKAYPFLQKNKIKCIPHDMSYCKYSPIHINNNSPRRLAIVGTCNTIAKGKDILNDFIDIYCDREIVLLGETPVYHNRKGIIKYGRYVPSELPLLLEKYNVDIVFFPSVWPETFSYIISELIKLNVSIISFNLGAQANKLKEYEKGYICSNFDCNYLCNMIRNI